VLFGGVQVKPDYQSNDAAVCSLGFNVTTPDGTRYFLTAAHCINQYTGSTGGTGAPFYQPCCYASDLIGSVAINPPWNLVDPRCPTTLCTQADVMAVQYTGSAQSDKKVGRTTCCVGQNSTAGSITIVGEWPVSAVTTLGLNALTWKLGRTSGWTEGRVALTCEDIVVNAGALGQYTVLCATRTSGMYQIGGDSGAPVYMDPLDNTRAAAGIMFAADLDLYTNDCPSPCLAWYSPWSNIQTQLGTTVTPY
jgi:hypothetical protein